MNDRAISRRRFLQVAAITGGVFVTRARIGTVHADDPAKKPSADDKLRWKSLFNGKDMSDWKASDFLRSGKVYVKDGTLVMEKGNQLTGATYRRGDFPKTDYEVVLDGMKIAGDDFFCTTTFPVGSSFCSFVVGGWGGSTVGLSSINSADASENETSTSKEFKPNVWYRFRVRVTTGRVQAWINDERTVDVDIENRRISTRIECNPSKPFGVATYATTGAIRNVRVRSLSADEIKEAAVKKAE
jgi:hypothetical protein